MLVPQTRGLGFKPWFSQISMLIWNFFKNSTHSVRDTFMFRCIISKDCPFLHILSPCFNSIDHFDEGKYVHISSWILIALWSEWRFYHICQLLPANIRLNYQITILCKHQIWTMNCLSETLTTNLNPLFWLLKFPANANFQMVIFTQIVDKLQETADTVIKV